MCAYARAPAPVCVSTRPLTEVPFPSSCSKGSVVVDYYLLLNNLVGELSTQDVNVLFKEKLRTNTMQMPDGEQQEVLQMGSLSIDPGFTDFVGK